MKLLGSTNILSGAASFPIPAGQYGGFMIRAAGTNQAGQTLTLANLGNVSVAVQGHGVIYSSFTALNNIPALARGVVETATAAGAAFTHSAFILPSFVSDGNIFDVSAQDNWFVDVSLGGVTGVIVASGTLEIFGIPQDGAQAYFPKMAMQSRNIAASSTDQFTLSMDNIGFLWIDGLTNIDTITIAIDGQTKVFGSPAELLAFSNWYWNPATALTDEILLDFVKSKTFDESLSDKFEITILTNAGGAATPVIIPISYEPTPQLFNRSKATYIAKRQDKLDRKSAAQKLSAVDISNKLSPISIK